MAWLDVIVGASVGLLIALLLSRLFISHPKITVVIIIAFAIFGLAISDNFLTPTDKNWSLTQLFSNLIYKK